MWIRDQSERFLCSESRSRVSGQADEHEREQSARIPLVVRQDVQVLEHVLVKQVRLVEQEDRMHALGAEVLHVLVDRVEDGGRGGFGREAECEADVAIEVAPAESRIVAVREPEAVGGQPMAYGAQHARLADAGLTGEQDVAAFVAGLDDLIDDAQPRRGYP